MGKKIGICTTKDLTHEWCTICNKNLAHNCGENCPLEKEDLCYDDPECDCSYGKLNRVIKAIKKQEALEEKE